MRYREKYERRDKKKGWIYIITHSLSPDVFKLGCSSNPILSDTNTMTGRLRSYESSYPMGEWELRFSNHTNDMNGVEEWLKGYCKNKMKFKPVKSKLEWFYGDWNKVIPQLKEYIHNINKDTLGYAFTDRLTTYGRESKKLSNKRSEKAKLANHLSKLGLNNDERWRVYYFHNIHTMNQLFNFENRKGNIKEFIQNN